MSETIELGAGEHSTQHLALDLRRIEGITDIIASVTDLPFRDNVFFYVRSSDVLEHVPWHSTYGTLWEWYRVLAVGGTLWIKTPNMQTLCEAYLGHHGSFPQAEIIRKIYGGCDYKGNQHQGGTDPQTLHSWLQGLGFSNISISPQGQGGDIFNMICVAVKK